MTTIIKPEMSKKNKYYIDKHRYYELKHFCLQYPTWRHLYFEIDSMWSRSCVDTTLQNKHSNDPVYDVVEKRMGCLEKMKLVERAAMDADSDLAIYILKAVTEDLSYNNLKTMLDIPCGRDMYYDRYRKFFWLLDQARE